jgi:hypothetical protein
MPRAATFRPATELRARAARIREHAWHLAYDDSATRLRELADDLEAQAKKREALAAIWDQVSAGWMRSPGSEDLL